MKTTLNTPVKFENYSICYNLEDCKLEGTITNYETQEEITLGKGEIYEAVEGYNGYILYSREGNAVAFVPTEKTR